MNQLCQHGRADGQCPACARDNRGRHAAKVAQHPAPPKAASPKTTPRVGQPTSEKGGETRMILWLFLGGIVGAVAIKLVDHFWPKKPQTVYHVPGSPENPALPPAEAPPGWWPPGE